MATRMYLVQLSRKKVLVEATSQEAAIRTATGPMVKSVTIPTPLEVARMMRDASIEVIAPSLQPAEPPKTEGQSTEGVGDMGLANGSDGQNSDGDSAGD